MAIILRPKASSSITHRFESGFTPALFDTSSDLAKDFWTFFAADIRNANTRTAYLRACYRFADWAKDLDLALTDIEPVHVAGYIEQLMQQVSIPTVKQHLTAIKRLFDHMVTHHHVTISPALSVRAPKYSVDKGKTPALSADEMKQLFDSIQLDSIVAYRDRAMIAVMAYTFARVGALIALKRSDYYTQSKRSVFKLLEKGSKYREIPAHHTAQLYVDEYIEIAGIDQDKHLPLFRVMEQLSTSRITDQAMKADRVWHMVKRRCAVAALPWEITNHSFRATGITTFIENGGTLEKAAAIAGHKNTTTTQLYDRSNDTVTLDDVERIRY